MPHAIARRQPPQTLWLLVSLLWVISPSSMAGGADNPSLSPSSLGFAGASSAKADEPDTVYYNPAGMVRIKRAVVSNGLTVLSAGMKVTDDGTTRVQDPGQDPCHGSGNCQPVVATDQPGHFLPQLIAIPNLYVVKPYSDTITLGLGVFTPLGAQTRYKAGWFGSGFVQQSQLQTVNINPSMAIRFDDKHSIGLGVSVEAVRVYQQSAVDVQQAGKYYADAILRGANNAGIAGIPVGSVVPLGTLYSDLLPGPAKSLLGQLLTQTGGVGGTGGVNFEGFGFGLGWNFGYLYQADDNTRLSLAYRSRIDMKVKGRFDWDLSKVTGTIPNIRDLTQTVSASDYLSKYYRPDSQAHSTVIDPQRLSLGLFHTVNQKLDLMADVSWANYDVVRNITLRIDDRTDPDGNTVRQGSVNIPTRWQNTFRVALGAAHHYDDQLTLKTGIAFDQSPIQSDATRFPAGPDSDRLILGLGAQYRRPDKTVLDVGYNLIMLKSAQSRYHESCTITYYERPNNAAGPTDECTANGGDFRASYSNGRIHVLGVSLTKPL